jgi:hypothetical protein
MLPPISDPLVSLLKLMVSADTERLWENPRVKRMVSEGKIVPFLGHETKGGHQLVHVDRSDSSIGWHIESGFGGHFTAPGDTVSDSEHAVFVLNGYLQ